MPSAFVTAENRKFVSGCTRSIRTLGITEPLGSVTLPAIVLLRPGHIYTPSHLPCQLALALRKPGCAFFAFDFQRASPSSVRRRLAASLVLEFHRRESGRGSPNRRHPRCCASASLVCSTSSMRDKSKVPAGQQTCALTPIAVSCCRIPA